MRSKNRNMKMSLSFSTAIGTMKIGQSTASLTKEYRIKTTIIWMVTSGPGISTPMRTSRAR